MNAKEIIPISFAYVYVPLLRFKVKMQVSSYLKFTDDAVIFFIVFRRLRLSTTKWKGCNEVVEAFELWNLLQFLVINLKIDVHHNSSIVYTRE